MEIIFARHGNTFDPGDRVIWIGRSLDLPLVAKGRQQARHLGKALARSGTIPADLFCGSLRRTRSYAEIVIAELGARLREARFGGRRKVDLTPVVDDRLDEIDYGEWTGRTRDEIVAQLGQGEELARWDEEGIWPETAGWAGSEAEIRRSLSAFIEEVVRGYGENDVLLVVTSNGILRYLGQITGARSRLRAEPPPPKRLRRPEAPSGAQARNESRNPTFKMKTGNIGMVDCWAGAFELLCWDVDPEEIGGKIGRHSAAMRGIE